MHCNSTTLKVTVLWIAGLLVSGLGAGQGQNAAQDDILPSPASGHTWKLVWQDEFDGNKIDTAKWDLPNNERRGHLWRSDNAYLDKKGHLVMETSKVGDRFASPCLRTRGK